MTTTKNRETTIEADPSLPTVKIVREFDAPPARVYRAWTERELVQKWMGPSDISMKIEEWDARTGGYYRYSALRDGEVVASFYGSFHEARQGQRLVQTFTYDGEPDGVSLDTITFEDLGDGRTRVVCLSVVGSMEARDMIMASGMETGVIDGYTRMDALLAETGW